MKRTLDQERSKYAYYSVKAYAESNNKFSDYRSLVKGFSTMIMNNGLGQALAFLKAKGKVHHDKLYEHINLWFRDNESKIKLDENNIKKDDILEAVISHSSVKYRYYTEETLAILNWFRKFVDAFNNKK